MDAKILTETGSPIQLDASMAWLVEYERAFRVDALLATLVLLGDGGADVKKPYAIAVMWAMARNHDPTTEAADEWMATIDKLDMEQAVPLLVELVESTYKKIEKADFERRGGGAQPGRITLMQLLSAGISRGLTLSDTKRFTLGMWLDFITAHNNLTAQSDSGDPGEIVRHATQADIDKMKN